MVSVDPNNQIVVRRVSDGVALRTLGELDMAGGRIRLSYDHETLYVMPEAIKIASGARTLAFPGSGASGDLAVDASQHLLAWVNNNTHCAEGGCMGDEVNVRDLTTGRLQALSSVNFEFDSSPALSADGAILAVQEDYISSPAVVRLLKPFEARNATDGIALSSPGCRMLSPQFRGDTHHVVVVRTCFMTGLVDLMDYDADTGVLLSQLRLIDPPGGMAQFCYDTTGQALLVQRLPSTPMGGYQQLPLEVLRNGRLVPLSVSSMWAVW